jgi:hypothetical protein
MARRANRGRGGKKNSKVNLQEVKVAMADASRSVDCEVELSEEEENCEPLDCGDVTSKLDAQGLLVEGIFVECDFAIDLIGNGVESVPALSEMEDLCRSECSDTKREVPVDSKLNQKNLAQDWRQLFRSEKSLGALQYFAPSREEGKVVVKPQKEAIEEGILKWSPSLVGQFLDKPLPFYIVKCTVDSLWAQYGKVEVFLMENVLYLFRFADERTKDEVMEEKLWHIANKPLILHKWTPDMQLLKLSLSTVPV